jgi:RNA polymerase sigma-70 factor (ECF subfamily)
MKLLTDEQLAELCREGNKEAFSVLVERYQNQIFSLAFRLGGDYDEAKDMAQEAFIRVFQNINAFNQGSRFFPWFYRVAHNSCINSLNKRGRRHISTENLFTEEMDATPTAINPEYELEKKEDAALIGKCLRELPPQFRIPLMLKYIEGLSYKEMAEKLDLPVSTIETRLFRGRKMLEKKISALWGLPERSPSAKKS